MTATRLVLVGLFCLALAACTVEPRAPSPTAAPTLASTTIPATTTTTLSVEDAAAGFRSCLADLGVSIEEIPFDSRGRPRLELAFIGVDFGDEAAVQSLTDCSEFLTAGLLDLSTWPQLQEQVQFTLESFSDCVRAHGVLTFPDPVSPFVGIGGPYSLEEIPFEDPDLEGAVTICAERVVEEGE